MTDLTPTEQHPRRLALGVGRLATVGTLAMLGILAPAMAGASPAADPPAPEGPTDLAVEQGCEPDCIPPEPPEDDCNPFLGSCDIEVGGNGPDPEPPPPECEDSDSCEPTEPPATGEPDGGGHPDVQVDAPVRATPTFTG